MSKGDKPAKLEPRLRFRGFCGKPAWDAASLSDIASFSSGGTPSKDNPAFWNGDIPWISASSMHDLRVSDSDHRVTSEAIGNGTRIAKEGSILILIRGSMLFKRVPICVTITDVAFNQDVKALHLKKGNDLEFVLYQLIAGESRIPINATGIGAGKIDTEFLKAMEIGRPDPAEQRKIAECLGSLDDRIAAETEALAALRRHKTGLMQQLFPRPGETHPRLRFPEFRDAREWRCKPLGELLDGKPSYGVNAAAVPFSEDLPTYVRITDIDDDGRLVGTDRVSVDIVASSDDYLRDGDIVLARTGASVGKSYRYRREDGRLVFAGFLIRIRPNPKLLNSTFLASYFFTGDFWDWVRLTSARSGQPGINGAEYACLPIPIPPPTNGEPTEQRRIANCLASLDDLISAKAEKLAILEGHKRGLMQQLFPAPDVAKGGG